LSVCVLGAAPSIANGVVAGIDYVCTVLDREAADLRRQDARGAAVRFHPVAPGVWHIDGRECREHRRSDGMVTVWLLLIARAAGLSAVPVEWAEQSDDALRKAVRRAAEWLKPHSAQLADIVDRMTVTRSHVFINALRTDPELIFV